MLDKVRTGHCDVVVMDITMPGKDGMETLAELKYEKPGLPVLMLSMHPEEQFAVRALKAGALGYLTKESAQDELLAATRKVSQGRKYVSSSLAERLASALQDGERSPHENLSDREYQVMRLLASGKTATEISKELGLSVKTISTHRSRVLKKMHLKSNSDLTRHAIHNRLI